MTDIKPKLSGTELWVSGYLCLVIDLIARPGALPVKFSASVTILASAIDIAVVYFLVAGVTEWKNGVKLFDVTQENSKMRLVFFCGFLVLAVSAGDCVVTTYRFLRSASDWQLSFSIFLVLAVGVAWYAARLGVFSIARTAEIVLVLLFFSAGIILVSNLGNASLQNLAISSDPAGEVVRAALRGFSVSPSLLAWFVLVSQSGAQKQSLLAKLLGGVFFSYVLFTLMSELALGGFSSGQSQPFYTLARIGSLSVFKRLDSLHSFLWSLVLIQKLAVLFYTASVLLQGSLPRSAAPKARLYGTALGVALTALILIRLRLQMLPIFLTVATILVFLLAAVRKGESPSSES